MKRSEYNEMRKKIVAECDEKLAALDKVFSMFGGTPAMPNTNRSPRHGQPSEWTHSVSKRDVIRNAVKAVAQESFSLKDIRSLIKATQPEIAPSISPNQLSAILSKLAERKEIQLLHPKVGKRPAVYTKKSDAVAQAAEATREMQKKGGMTG